MGMQGCSIRFLSCYPLTPAVCVVLDEELAVFWGVDDGIFQIHCRCYSFHYACCRLFEFTSDASKKVSLANESQTAASKLQEHSAMRAHQARLLERGKTSGRSDDNIAVALDCATCCRFRSAMPAEQEVFTSASGLAGVDQKAFCNLQAGAHASKSESCWASEWRELKSRSLPVVEKFSSEGAMRRQSIS